MKTRRWIALLAALVMLLGLMPEALAYAGGVPGATCDHNYVIIENTSTCTDWGMITRRCTKCGDIQYEYRVPPRGHKWGPWTVDEPANCIEYATLYRVCQRCGLKEWKRDYDSGLGDHDWGEWTRVKEPTPEAPGLEERVCKIYAGHREEREVPYDSDGASLHLDVSWAADAGAGMRYVGAMIPVDVTLTNTCDKALYVWRLYGDWWADFVLPHGWEWIVNDEYARLDPGESMTFTYFHSVNADEVNSGNASEVLSYWASYDFDTELKNIQSNPASINIPLTDPHDENYLDVYLTYQVAFGPSYPIQEGDIIELLLTIHNDSDVEIFTEDIVIDLPYSTYQFDDPGWPAVQHSSVFAGSTISYPYQVVVSADDVANGQVVRAIANTFTPSGGEYSGKTMQTNFVVPAFDLDGSTTAYQDVEAKLTWAFVSSDKPITLGSAITVELTVWNISDEEITLTGIGVLEIPPSDDFSGWDAARGTVIPPHGSVTYPYTIHASAVDVDDVGYVRRTVYNEFKYVDAPSGLDSYGYTNDVEMTFDLDGFVVAPALKLDAAWAPDAGVGKRYEGAQVDVDFTLTNIGDCEVLYKTWQGIPELVYTSLPAAVTKDIGYGDEALYSLAPGGSLGFTFTYTVAAPDVAAGSITDSWDEMGFYLDASFTWTDDNGNAHDWWDSVYSNVAKVDIPLTDEAESPASLHLVTEWAPDAGDGKGYAGALITLHDTLTNTGTVPLFFGGYSSIAHDFSAPNGWITSGIWTGYTVLYPGESLSYDWDYSVEPADVNAGAVAFDDFDYGWYEEENGSSAVCYSNYFPVYIPLTAGGPTPTDHEPQLTLIASQLQPGGSVLEYPDDFSPQEIVYDCTIINTGAVPLDVTHIYVSWHHTDGSQWNAVFNALNGLPTVLWPGDFWEGKLAVSVTSEMVNFSAAHDEYAGTVDITMAAIGYTIDDDHAICRSNEESFYYDVKDLGPTGWVIPSFAELSVLKEEISFSADPSGYQLGEEIEYRVTVTNTGDETVTAIEVHDELQQVDLGYSLLMMGLDLAPGESWSGAYTHRVTLDDVAKGYVYNQAFAWWDDPITGEALIKTYSNSVTVPVTDKTGLMFKKAVLNEKPNGEPFYEGEEIEFQVTILNNMPTHAYNVYVDDDLAWTDSMGPNIASYPDLGPGEGDKVTFKYTVTAYDAKVVGGVYNDAYGLYYDEQDNEHFITSNQVYVPCGVRDQPPFGVISDVSVVKTETSTPAYNPNYYTEGEVITYDITVTNTGEVPVEIIVYDSLKLDSYGEIGSEPNLYPGDSRTYHYQWTVTQFDCEVVGYVLNYALVRWHPATGWQDTITKSNEVKSPTSADPLPPPPTLTLLEGDSCELTLKGLSAASSRYLQHLCGEHAAVDDAVQALLAEKGDDAWPEVYRLWRDALDAEYQKLLEQVIPSARVSVMNDRMNFYLWLSSYEAALALIHPDDPAAVGELVTNALMDRCADVCYVLHNAPEARADSMAGKRLGKNQGAMTIGRTVLSRVNGDIDYAETLNGELAAIQTSIVETLEGTQGSARVRAFQRAQRLWQVNLDASVNARYKAADAEARETIAMNRVFLDQMLAARAELVETIYDEAVAAELIAKEYMHNAMFLYEEK